MKIISKHKFSQYIVSYCEAYGVDTVVTSPGSRNAPLIIGFNGSKKIKQLSVVDERCAAFFALGMAQQKQKPVAVLCTSGSALLNYYPAIAEAFYSNIPLIVISADRPAHLIDVGDGQTIRQENVFQNHSLYNANLGKGKEKKIVEEAFLAAIYKKGPVHINVPFGEPLYDYEEVEENTNKIPYKSINTSELPIDNLPSYASIWNNASKKIILVGQHFPNEELQRQLVEFSKDPSVLLLVENTANVSNPAFINSIDKLIFPFSEEEIAKFKPDVLLTLGGLIVSKKIKQHLRKYPPLHHWHIDKKTAYDTFHCLTKHFKTTPNTFFMQFKEHIKHKNSNYQKFWLNKKRIRLQKHEVFLKNTPFSDLKVFSKLMCNLPKNSQLQLSNSATIRYSQLFDLDASIQVFCNRGTSGIDGSTSTAIGAAVGSTLPTTFITGDISFFYDSNALWNQYIPKTFRIILINNNGGGIFRFIPGPQDSKALSYFETTHTLTAQHLCEMYGFEYAKSKNEDELEAELSVFYKPSSKPKLLEVLTPRELNDKVLKEYFLKLQ